MERGVIEIFDLLRPEVDPRFLISQTPRRLGLPLFDEIEKRKFNYSFLSDRKGWERLAKPRSLSHLYKMLVGLLRGNLDALREVRRHDMLYVPNLFAAYYALLAMLFCRLTQLIGFGNETGNIGDTRHSVSGFLVSGAGGTR